MTRTRPTVTIGLTSFNAEETLQAALDSAFSQTYPIEQIIVVDDHSTDSSPEILRAYESRSGFEWVRNTTNSGVAASRNEIIRRATGEFLVFFDDDDVSDPSRVEDQVRRTMDYECEFSHGAPVLCHTARLQVFPDGVTRIETAFGQQTGQAAPSGDAVIRKFLLGEPHPDTDGSFATCSQAARTKIYRQLGGFDECLRRCEDTELSLRAALIGAHFVGIAEPLVTQKMTFSSDKNLENHFKYSTMMLEKHRDMLQHMGVYAFCKDWNTLKFQWLTARKFAFARSTLALALRHPLLTWRRARVALPGLGQFRHLE